MTDTPDATRQTEELALALLESAALIERSLDTELSHVRGISFSEYRLLNSLSLMPNRSAPRVMLAQAVGLTPSAVTRALKPLGKLGYVITHRSDRDARRSLAELTAGGTALLADASAVVAQVLQALPLDTLHRADVLQLRDDLRAQQPHSGRRG